MHKTLPQVHYVTHNIPQQRLQYEHKACHHYGLQPEVTNYSEMTQSCSSNHNIPHCQYTYNDQHQNFGWTKVVQQSAFQPVILIPDD